MASQHDELTACCCIDSKPLQVEGFASVAAVAASDVTVKAVSVAVAAAVAASDVTVKAVFMTAVTVAFAAATVVADAVLLSLLL